MKDTGKEKGPLAAGELFRKNLKRFRAREHLSQLALALASGVSQNMITYLETGKRSPTILTLERLSHGLHVEVRDFFSVEGRDESRERELMKRKVCALIMRL